MGAAGDADHQLDGATGRLAQFNAKFDRSCRFTAGAETFANQARTIFMVCALNYSRGATTCGHRCT
jgi:hypothetical protein